MVAVSDFSGLMSSAWALAKAEASAATGAWVTSLSSKSKLTAPDLERFAFTPCPMASLASSGIKALSSLLARSWSRKALRVLRKRAANSAQEFDELISTMRTASMRGRGGPAKMRWGGSPDWTQRQNFFSAETRTLRYSGSMGIVISTHLPPPVMIDSTASRECVTHILCWTWAMYFSAAVSSENDQGSMNLASNIASVSSMMPSRVAAIHGMAECLTRRWISVTRRPVLRSYQERLSASVAAPSCTTKLPDRDRKSVV